jgi:very-short-patch-repair endonuclease
LEQLGFEIMEEVPFPPYTVDTYVKAYHLAIEVDGPQHRKSADAKRDADLQDVYGLVMFHIRDEDFANREAISESAMRLLTTWHKARDTVDERVERVKMRLPWIF